MRRKRERTEEPQSPRDHRLTFHLVEQFATAKAQASAR
jgi:hypothetical protein